jgi:hypothetical protein
LDEIHIDIMPVLLGGGLRFFDDSTNESIILEKISVSDATVRTHLWLRLEVNFRN